MLVKLIIYPPEFLNGDGDIERTCAACNESWPSDTEFFHENKKGYRGLKGTCKACTHEKYMPHRPIKDFLWDDVVFMEHKEHYALWA